jgi:hypothetical protein
MKVLLCILLLVGLAVGQIEKLNTIYGGIAIATGEGSGSMNPGPTVCFESIAKFIKYFGIGGHAEYAWLTVKVPSWVPSNSSAGVHLWDLALVPKGYLPVGNNVNFALEIDPGFAMSYAYVREGSDSYSNFKIGFGMTYGISFTYKALALAVKYKSDYMENGHVDWISFTIGFTGFGK